MKNGKSLIETNIYLQDEKLRETLIMEHAIASARIEGVPNPARIAEELSGYGSHRTSSKSTAKRA